MYVKNTFKKQDPNPWGTQFRLWRYVGGNLELFILWGGNSQSLKSVSQGSFLTVYSLYKSQHTYPTTNETISNGRKSFLVRWVRSVLQKLNPKLHKVSEYLDRIWFMRKRDYSLEGEKRAESVSHLRRNRSLPVTLQYMSHLLKMVSKQFPAV